MDCLPGELQQDRFYIWTRPLFWSATPALKGHMPGPGFHPFENPSDTRLHILNIGIALYHRFWKAVSRKDETNSFSLFRSELHQPLSNAITKNLFQCLLNQWMAITHSDIGFEWIAFGIEALF